MRRYGGEGEILKAFCQLLMPKCQMPVLQLTDHSCPSRAGQWNIQKTRLWYWSLYWNYFICFQTVYQKTPVPLYQCDFCYKYISTTGWGSICMRRGTHLDHHLLKCCLHWEDSIYFPQNYFLVLAPKLLFLCSEQQESPPVDKLTTVIFCSKPLSQNRLCQWVSEFWSCELGSSIECLLPCAKWKQL